MDRVGQRWAHFSATSIKRQYQMSAAHFESPNRLLTVLLVPPYDSRWPSTDRKPEKKNSAAKLAI
jgi:hypothetical protein